MPCCIFKFVNAKASMTARQLSASVSRSVPSRSNITASIVVEVGIVVVGILLCIGIGIAVWCGPVPVLASLVSAVSKKKQALPR